MPVGRSKGALVYVRKMAAHNGKVFGKKAAAQVKTKTAAVGA